eukprot:jgi/Mesvir1/13685/Mv26075-RA.1
MGPPATGRVSQTSMSPQYRCRIEPHLSACDVGFLPATLRATSSDPKNLTRPMFSIPSRLHHATHLSACSPLFYAAILHRAAYPSRAPRTST